MSAEPQPPAEPICSPADVAVWLRARTQDDEGREVGLFNESTRPSVGQVEQAIETAHSMVALRVGWAAPQNCLEGYRWTVALFAAAMIEKSYFPEQISDNRSHYPQLSDELAQAMQDLYQCIVDGGMGPGGPEGGGQAYDVCTPYVPCGAGPRLFVPANWDNPYADDVDDEGWPSAAQAWLTSMQSTWQGTIDADGNPISPAPAMVDTRGSSA